MKRRLQTKKVLVAAIGVATVSYAFACGETQSTSGNLMAPDADTSADARNDSNGNADVSSSGNLMAPPPVDAEADTALDSATLDTGADVSSSGNLMPPPDASND